MPLRSKTRRGEPGPIDYINHRRAASMPISNSTLDVGRRAFGGFPTKPRQSYLVHRHRMKWILSLSLPLYALDQITKYWILRHVDPDSNLEIIRRWFYLVNVPNTGAAFGSFKNNNAFFIVLSLIAMVAVLSILLRKQGRPDAWRDLSLALLLAGVMGNLTDRIVHGHVTDFLLFNLHIRFANPWPAFNVADSCICIAVISFIIHTLRQKPSATEGRAD
jgi:signal peptidase II